MKTKIIQTERYYLLLDEEAEIILSEGYVFNNNATPKVRLTDEYKEEGDIKIIAHLPEKGAPKLKGVPKLPPLPSNEEDVENILFSYGLTGNELIDIPNKPFPVKVIANACYKAAQANKYSEEDKIAFAEKVFHLSREMFNGFSLRLLTEDNKNIKMVYPQFTDILKVFKNKNPTLSTDKKPKNFEFEMECSKCGSNPHHSITTECKENQQPKVIKGILQGKWIY